MALQCTSNYPSDPYNANVAVIKWLGETYDVIPGFSDHSNDFRCSSLALANGARVFERHFTLDKSMPGPDHKASSNPEEMIRYIKNLKESQRIIGHSQKTIAEEELNMRRISRKGVYLKRDYPAGAIVDRKDLVCIRPAMGDDVRSIFICLSRPLKTALQKGQQLRQEHF
jgi:sialic acid synthase SpsE